MGRDKASLPFGGVTILDRILGELARGFDDLILVAAPVAESPSLVEVASRSNVTIIHDDTPHEGPVGALARGFSVARHPSVFACSCDQPLVSGAVARALCAMLDGAEAVIPEIDGWLHPLHAAYRRAAALAALRAMEAEGERRLTALALRLQVRRVGAAELRPLDPELRSLINVNTPEEYARALHYAEGREGD
jgi:molybdenum cofactor guanylyltransferase